MKTFKEYSKCKISISVKVSEFENYIKLNYPVISFSLQYNKFNNSIYLDAIEVKHQGYGIGKEIMNKLLDFSDKNKIPILLNPQSDNVKDLKRLYDFYKSFGFTENNKLEYSGKLIYESNL